MSEYPVTDISILYNVALVTMDHLPNNITLISDMFNKIAQQSINVDMISQAPPFRGSINLSFSMPSENLVTAISTLNTFKKSVPQLQIEVDAFNTKISVYGQGMKSAPGVAAKLFTILAENGVDVKLVTTSEVDISFLVEEKDVDKTLDAIKKEFNL